MTAAEDNGGIYGPLAAVYDRLNRGVDYIEWADFYEACFTRFAVSHPRIVLDLGCGTGRMTYELLSRGYDMIGIDGSVDMLSEAAMRREDPVNPLLLHQDMRSFELYGSVGAVVSTLDGVNYLVGDGDLLKCFKCVFEYLEPGGVFLFDLNTPYKFVNIFGNNAYILGDDGNGAIDGGGCTRRTDDSDILEDSDNCDTEIGQSPLRVFCAWQNGYNPTTRICDFYLTIFEEREDGSYLRSEELQRERCFSLDEIKCALYEAGLEICGVYGGFDFSTPADNCERWHIAARRPL